MSHYFLFFFRHNECLDKVNRHILIVEDVKPMLDLMGELLLGYQVSLARNLKEARWEINRERPDVVILDEVLPGESIGDFISELNSLNIPVILVTGMENPSHPVPKEVVTRLFKPSLSTLTEDRLRFEKTLLLLFKS